MNCEHKKTLRISGEDTIPDMIMCADCDYQETESQYTERKEQHGIL